MAAIELDEATLRDLVAAQIFAKFDDPKLMRNFIESVLYTKVDQYGHFHANGSKTMLTWSVEKTIGEFVAEVTKEWIQEHRSQLAEVIEHELAISVVQNLAKEVAGKVKIG